MVVLPNARATESGDGWIRGEGTCFEVTNSTYLNVTLCSSQVVNVTLESVPSVVSFTIQAVGNATSTGIEMSGFVPNETYYRHEDGHLKETFEADQTGTYSYAQDLSAPHHVFIAEEHSTKYIRDAPNGGDCHQIGTWDGTTKTCLLSRNVFETVVLDANGLTLDGGGHSVTYSAGSYAVYASSRSALTVRNTIIGGASIGIMLVYSSGTITGNTISGVEVGIYLSSSGSSTVRENTVTAKRSTNSIGIRLTYSPSSTVAGNAISASANGAYVESSGATTISGNSISLTSVGALGGILLAASPQMSLSNNAMASGGIVISASSPDQADTHVIDVTNTVGGKPVRYCRNTSGGTIQQGAGQVILAGCSNTIVEDQVMKDVGRAIYVVWGSGNIIRRNSVSNSFYGMTLWFATSSSISENSIAARGIGVELANSGGSTASANVLTLSGSGPVGILLFSAGYEVTGNTISASGPDSGAIGIRLLSASAVTVSGNTLSMNGPNAVGISVYSSMGNNLEGNTIAGGTAIWLGSFSSGNTVSENTVSGDGIELYFTSGNTVVANTISITTTRGWGITVESYSIGNTISENMISGGKGIFVTYFSNDNTVTRNTIENAGTYGSGIILQYADGNLIGENVMTTSVFGIRLVSSDSNIATGNDVTVVGSGQYANYYGLSLSGSGGNSITGNRVSGAYYGVLLSNSGSNVLDCNEVVDNTYGAYVQSSSGNLIFHNGFIDNTYEVHSVSSTNTWNNPANRGNYWTGYTGEDNGSGGRTAGDGVGDTDLPHEGVDWYPLMHVPGQVCGRNSGPVITSFRAPTTTEGSPTLFFTDASDDEGDPLTYTYDFDSDGVPDQTGPDSTASFVWYDDHAGTATVMVSDGELTADAQTGVEVLNANPGVAIASPSSGLVVAVGSSVTFTGIFGDPGTEDTHVAKWTFSSWSGTQGFPGTISETGGHGTVVDVFAFPMAGVYRFNLTVTDDDGGTGSASTVDEMEAFIVVYDPSDGFVTGGGWIDSPPGAYTLDPMLTGKATFGFVSKYDVGRAFPTGETEFQFRVAPMNFHSVSYEWLVCGGPRCQYKGSGTLNGVEGYSFMLTAIDGDLRGGGGTDKFRMKIWLTITGQIIYDNQAGSEDGADLTTVISGGSIVIHKG